MKHYIYKTTFTETGEYYIGKHSTSKLNDNYVGSGLALTKEKLSEPFTHEILEYCETSDLAYEREKVIIGNLYLTDELCLNRCGGGWRGKADNRKGMPQTEEWTQKIAKSNSKPKTGVALKATLANAKRGAESRRGMKDSDEVKAKRAASLSKALTGVPQVGRRKKIVVDNEVHVGLQATADRYDISTATVRNRINSDNFPNWNWQ